MAEGDTDLDVNGGPNWAWLPGRGWQRLLLAFAVAVLVAMAVVWLLRDRIANNIISGQLAKLGLPATYHIDHVGPVEQVLTNIAIGDPHHPDLTIERAKIELRYRLGLPAISAITLDKPRVYGRYHLGKFSFGSLDKALIGTSQGPAALPAIDVRLHDARGLIESDFGPFGVKLEGAGSLYDGFDGALAVNAPKLAFDGCEASKVTLYGRIRSSQGKPGFSGPARLGHLSCQARNLRLDDATASLDLVGNTALTNLGGKISLETGGLAMADARANGLNGTFRATLADSGSLTTDYTLAARGITMPQVRVALATFDGTLRAGPGFDHVDLQSSIEGNGLRLGSALDLALERWSTVARDTPAGPLLGQMHDALTREAKASSVTVQLAARRTGNVDSVVIPRANLRGGSGASLLSVSQVQLAWTKGGVPRLSGNLSTGGAGLPKIVGRMERGRGGRPVLRMRMADYVAQDAQLSMPEMVLAQAGNGDLVFSGRVVASGPLAGGSIRNLALPVDGRWSRTGRITVGRECAPIQFEELTFASLNLENRSIDVCPEDGHSIVEQGGGALRIAARMPSLDLAGRLGSQPVRIASGPIEAVYPGVSAVSNLDVELGSPKERSRFRIGGLTADLSRGVEGTIANTDVKLSSVPLDLLGAHGRWKYSNGELITLSGGNFMVQDRHAVQRFDPLAGTEGKLSLKNGVIKADATLRAPKSQREVMAVDIVHRLANGTGHADLLVPGLVFDKQLQPDELSYLMLGVIANAKGTVQGVGKIDWNADRVTSSGRFSSDGLDFAAAFGPVKGASGTVEFTDLLGMTTAPDQKLFVQSVNPGIEVRDGTVTYSISNGELLAVKGATWPFMGGELLLHPTNLKLGVSEERHYVFEVIGLDAAQFVQHWNFQNLSATGVFDGTLPIIFDQDGNGRIEDGLLIARAPGGNVSYLGNLTYKDKGAIANFAFNALKSLDYKQMSIAMDGPLTGEIVTKVRFDGVSQGEGAQRNFITRQLSKLPIRFNVNISAPFYKLIGSLRSMYDPTAIRDPRDLGLIDAQGKPSHSATGSRPSGEQTSKTADEPTVQTHESEKQP